MTRIWIAVVCLACATPLTAKAGLKARLHELPTQAGLKARLYELPTQAGLKARLYESIGRGGSLDPPAFAAQRGQGRQGGPASARASAPVDLTGLWVSIITEDWRWRMRTPPKGDYASLPLTDAAIKAADSWDPAKDAAAGEQCRAFGGAAIMRMPGRIRITWSDDMTLKVETEAGTQTRAFVFAPVQAGEPSWQGISAATWQPAGGGGGRRGGGPARGGSLKVVTTNLRPGYLRRNGVPYSANARVTEYFNRVNEANGDSWLIVTTMVEDPQYLNARFVTSSHFKKVPDDAPWKPTACE